MREFAHRLLGPAAAAQDGHGVLGGLRALGQLGHLRGAGCVSVTWWGSASATVAASVSMSSGSATTTGAGAA